MDSAVRLFGARELVLGLGLLGVASTGGRKGLVLGLVADGLDVLTVSLGARDHRLGPHTVIVGGGLASAAVALGLRSIAASQPASR